MSSPMVASVKNIAVGGDVPAEVADRFRVDWVPIDAIRPSPENDELYGQIAGQLRL